MSDLIVVDIQPSYRAWFNFDMEEFIEYLYEFNTIYFLYNGPEMGYEAEDEILNWLIEYGLDEERVNIKFYEKGYGFFRDLMEYVDEDKLIQLGKFLNKKRYYDLRDIQDNDIQELLDEQFPKEYLNGDDFMFTIREDIYEFLENAKNPIMIGGGENECLKEIEILLQIFDKEYELNFDYIY